jgi:hypothetical protein
MLWRKPLWSSGQSSWLQIQRSGFDSQRYQVFLEVVGLERGSLSLVSTIEELLKRKGSGSSLKSREYCRNDPLCWPRNTLYPRKLALTSPTSGGRSTSIVRSRTKAKTKAVFRNRSACASFSYRAVSMWFQLLLCSLRDCSQFGFQSWQFPSTSLLEWKEWILSEGGMMEAFKRMIVYIMFRLLFAVLFLNELCPCDGRRSFACYKP